MTRKELLESFRESLVGIFTDKVAQDDEEIMEFYLEVCCTIAETYAEDKWISLEDRLPECHEQHSDVYSSGRILIYGDEGVETAEFLTYPFFTEWHGCQGKVTHWLPLPKKPNN